VAHDARHHAPVRQHDGPRSSRPRGARENARALQEGRPLAPVPHHGGRGGRRFRRGRPRVLVARGRRRIYSRGYTSVPSNVYPGGLEWRSINSPARRWSSWTCRTTSSGSGRPWKCRGASDHPGAPIAPRGLSGAGHPGDLHEVRRRTGANVRLGLVAGPRPAGVLLLEGFLRHYGDVGKELDCSDIHRRALSPSPAIPSSTSSATAPSTTRISTTS